MAWLAALVRVQHGRHPIHSMVMIDAQTVKGGRAGPTFHNAGGRDGRTIGTKRSILVEILGLPIAARKRVKLDIKAPPKGTSGFVPLGPLYKVEHAFAQFGRWRRLSRCYEGTEASARAWLEVASVGYLFGRL
jgi:hypothetical protein